ncbi:hypothetical protein [Niallia sp. 01092]|uniref:hypothetical protein n=1 Tax=unclassified Niallia TaxID=2837522 RepID=UPI003FD0F427
MTTHYSFEQWLKYVKNELEEHERILLEDHLYTCDQCLDIYVTAVAEQETVLPTISDETAFTDQIMMRISNEEAETKLEVKTKKRRRFYHSTIFQYTLAAAVTLILMSTGVFQSIIQHTENIQKAEIPTKKEAVTVGFVDKTFSWMDELEGNIKEEKK